MDNESIERLMNIILQMKINLAHVNETLQQQTHEIRAELSVIFEGEKKALESCLSNIDEKLKECSVYVDDYQRRYTALSAMREKLVKLGAEPGAMPAGLPSLAVEDVVAWRVKELNHQGKNQAQP